MKAVWSSVLLSLVVACSQEVPSKAPAQPSVAVAPLATPAAPVPVVSAPADSFAPSALELREFSVALDVPADCSSDPVTVATVRWDTRARNAADVAIFVESPGNTAKLWLEGAATGEVRTGKWVFAKSLFTLRNRTSGEVLATRLVGGLACPG